MDNKITKKRLANLFAYEWIIMIVCLVALILVWELVFTVSAVRLTVGQQYNILFDLNVNSTNTSGLMGEVLPKFSYEIMEANAEAITDEATNKLNARLTLQECDVIFTSKEQKEDKTTVRIKTLIDGDYTVYNYERLLSDAQDYLAQFLKDEFSDKSQNERRALAMTYSNLDEDKIDAHFLERTKKDNRFRTKKQQKAGMPLERSRIENLCLETLDFKKLLNYSGENLFFRYTRYEQSLANGVGEDKEFFQTKVNQEESAGRKDAIYGLNLAGLPTVEGKNQASAFFNTGEDEKVDDVVLMVYDFRKYQPDLQFETITFINTMVRSFSDILDK